MTAVSKHPEASLRATDHSPLEALRHREAFFHKVLEQSGDVTSVLAPDGTRLFISSGVTAVLGYSEEEALRLKATESTHPEDRERVAAVFRRLAATPGASERVRFRQRRQDGSYRLVDALLHGAVEDPEVGGVVVTLRDVTEQARLEEQLQQAQKLESVGRLAGGVAHDFNNLLTVILTCGELLAREVRGDAAQWVREIAEAGDRARVLTRQLLAFSRKGPVRPEPVDLSAQVRARTGILRRLVGEDVQLEVRLERSPWTVRCDPGQLDQVLLNLVVNARDAMPDGGHLTIETANVPGAGGEPDQVRLTVRDTGTGLSDEVRAHLFEPFFTTKEPGRGTGLGLATVHGIVQQHQGRLTVESAPGRGTAFTMVLPRCPPAPAASAPGAAPTVRPARERLLLVEDDLRVRHLAEVALAEAGYRVWPAVDGETACRLLGDASLELDLVVTDAVLPGLGGLEVAAAAARRERGPVPVLFTSGYPPDRLAARGLVGPALDLVPKPYAASMLVARVRQALDRAAGRAGLALG